MAKIFADNISIDFLEYKLYFDLISLIFVPISATHNKPALV